MQRPQRGFTLVEIAIVLVVIGLLLGGVLKGQELIASSRVRNIADQQAGLQAAFYGFQDRYRAVPGDMFVDDAESAIGQSIRLGTQTAGESDGQLSDPSGSNWPELNGVWEHLSKAGFIQGTYTGQPAGGVDPAGNPPTSDHAPINVFNGVVVMGHHSGFASNVAGTPSPRLVLHLGRNVPVDIARELDVKVDDGSPDTGTLRDAATGGNEWQSTDGGSGSITCVDSGEWNITGNAQDCNPTYLF